MPKRYRFSVGAYEAIKGKPVYQSSVRIEMSKKEALRLIADIIQQLNDDDNTGGACPALHGVLIDGGDDDEWGW